MRKLVLMLLICSIFPPLIIGGEIDKKIAAVEQKVIEWRRDFHKHPELSNREFRTAEIVAKHLKSLGLEVQKGVAHTGVVGVLRGSKPGRVVALRADMDALPVTERTDVPYKSTVTTEYNGDTVGVMHACGHDTHVAILMGVAEVLAGMRKELPGTVKFIFQPAEEGPPVGERGGAELMVEEGVLQNPDVDVIFGLHISANTDINVIEYRAGGIMASADDFKITLHGKQTHGSRPWGGIDPIVIASQIITGMQTIISRQTELTRNPAVITVGSIHGGVRSNIIPEKLEMIGTIRAFDPEMQKKLHSDIRRTATLIAKSGGATAEVQIPLTTAYPVTYNDVALTKHVVPILEKIAGDSQVRERLPITGAEDFSFFAREVPGFFFFLGGKPLSTPKEEAAAHHTPDFFIDDSGLQLGVKAFIGLALDALETRTDSE